MRWHCQTWLSSLISFLTSKLINYIILLVLLFLSLFSLPIYETFYVSKKLNEKIKTDENKKLFPLKYQESPSSHERPQVQVMTAALKPPRSPIRITQNLLQNKLKLTANSKINSSSAVYDDTKPPYQFPLKEYTQEILGMTKYSENYSISNPTEFYDQTVSNFFDNMKKSSLENHYSLDIKHEMQSPPGTEAIYNNYSAQPPRHTPHTSLAKVMQMKTTSGPVRVARKELK